MSEHKKINIGGQAVIEGVMMRSPKAFTVAVRRADGSIAIREEEWKSIWDRLKFLRWPFLRGAVVMIEAMTNGLSALTFSANEASRQFEEEKKDKEKESEAEVGEKEPTSGEPLLSTAAIALTMAFSFVFGIALFVGLPHFLTWGLGFAVGVNLDVDSFWFHLIDGVIKVGIFILYIWGISFMPDIKRVFMYHGAEHKAIYAYEKGLELTVDNARVQTRFHPRCGTSFLINVLMISILIFSAVFPFVPKVSEIGIINQVANVGMKIALMLPIAGIAYEFIKFAGKRLDLVAVSFLIKPGLWMQKLTTYEPEDDQLEVAIISIKTALKREADADSPIPHPDTPLMVIRSLDELGY